MAGGKWIEGLTTTTPLQEAARRVLTVRLEIVRDSLPLAVHESARDPEHVHQLRVGTRRARAALDIFADCLPAKVYRTARQTLRRLRRAAGAARDWDVFLLELTRPEQAANRRRRAGLDLLIGYALGHRQQAQVGLEEAGADYPFAFDQFFAETIAAVQDPADPGLVTLGDLARPLLGGLFRELEEAAAGDLEDYEHLHRVRIVGKRLRYALEVLSGCLPAPYREQIYPAVEEMQEILGEANDSHVARLRLEALRAALPEWFEPAWKRYRPGLEGLLRFHQERLPRKREEFRTWWGGWQRYGKAGFFTPLKTPEAPTG